MSVVSVTRCDTV